MDLKVLATVLMSAVSGRPGAELSNDCLRKNLTFGVTADYVPSEVNILEITLGKPCKLDIPACCLSHLSMLTLSQALRYRD